jgi:hypothetical protein
MVLVGALVDCALPECLMMCMYVLPPPHMFAQINIMVLEAVL